MTGGKIVRVLCFGSLNIDKRYLVDHFVRKGETLSSESYQVFGGGKGLNQSIAMARAGIPVWHAGAVGADGDFLIRMLKEAGVCTEYVRVLDQQCTGHAIIQNDKEGDNCILLYGGANQAVTREHADQVLKDFGEDTILVLQNEISELAYIMKTAHERGIKIVLNPSPMDPKIKELPLEYVDYFILNEVEAAGLTGIKLTAEADGVAAALRLRERFPGAAVVLTLGAQGSVYADSETIIRQDAYIVDAVDTTAAGDTFTGYFIAGLLKNSDMREAMDQASRAAALAVMRPGAAPSIPTAEEVRGF